MSEEVTTETVEAEETVTEATEAEETEEQETVEDPAAGLKSALQKERQARKDAEKQARDLKRQIEDASKSSDEKALDDVRREAAAEATAKANARIVAAEFRVAAAKRVKDPRIAAKLVDLTDVGVDDDGNVDSDDLTAALDALLVEYPDLAPSRFEGTADQGGVGKKTSPSQLTRDDLKNMSPDAIIQAEKDGRLDRLKGKIK